MPTTPPFSPPVASSPDGPGLGSVGGGLLSSEAQSGTYIEYTVVVTYNYCGGLAQLPAAENVNSSVIQTSQPYCQKIVTWSIKKTGSLPKIPSPLVDDPNLKLDKAIINLPAAQITPNLDTQTFTVTGVYTYFTPAPWTLEGPLQGTKVPTNVTPMSQNSLTAGNFTRGIF